MSYVISGTTVTSVDYTDVPFGGTDGTGNALSAAETWVSYTMDRPNVRTHPDGRDYFTIKNVSFRVCSAPPEKNEDGITASGVAYPMYGRISFADGTAYINSYASSKTGAYNSIAWQTAPTHTYTFQTKGFHVEDNLNGSTIRLWLVSAGPFLFQRNSGGAGHTVGAAGQTFAGSPVGYITISQIASPPLNFKVARTTASVQNVTMTWSPPTSQGGTSSGYHVQVAEDPGFTTGLREYYPAIKSGGALTYTSTGYSQKKPYYFRIAMRNETSEWFGLKGGQWSEVGTIDIDTTTQANPPADSGVEGGTAGAGTNGSGGSVSGSAGGATGSSGSSGVIVVGTTPTAPASGAGTGGSTPDTVGGTPNDPTDTSGGSGSTGTSGSTGNPDTSTAGTATSDLAKVLVRINQVQIDLNALDTHFGAAVDSPGKEAFRTARSDTNALNNDANYIAQRSAGTTWLDDWSAITALYQTAYSALSTVSLSLTAADIAKATTAVNALIAGIHAAIDATPATDPSGGGGGANPSNPGSGVPTDDDGDGGTPPVIVYTPIPDTSALRSSKYGRLISRQPNNTETRVFLYDRGGKRRLGQLHGYTQVTWGRIRDDISSATVTLTPEMAKRNEAILARLGVARSEIVVFRGNQRVWEGPVTYAAFKRSGVEIQAKDWLWYANKTPMHNGYSNAYPNVGYVVDRIAGILSAEMTRLETPVRDAQGRTLVPAINVLDYLHTYVQEDDARTSSQNPPYSGTVWGHLDDLAAKAGIDYTVIGRALHIWDTSRSAMGRTRTVSEKDFIGDPYIAQYGSEVATVYTVTDGQGDFASYFSGFEIDNPYYGQLELVATAYGSQSTTTTTDAVTGATSTTTVANTVDVDAMADQAVRGSKGRDPVPWALHVPDGSSIDVSRSGLGIDVMVPGVYVPIIATFSGRTFSQIQKIKSIQVTVSASKAGQDEQVQVTMEPASHDDAEEAEAAE